MAADKAHFDNHPLPADIQAEALEHLISECDANVDPADIRLDMSLREDLDLDSMQAVSLSLDLEDKLEITLEDSDLARLDTVKDLLDVIQEKLAEKSGN